MNELIKPGQRAMGIDDDGIRGPITDRELGKAFDEGRVTIIPRVPAPVTTPDDPPWVTAMKVAFGWHEVRDKTKLQAWLKSDGKTLGDPTALPWCGDAVETAMKNGVPGIDVPEKPYWARNWLRFGRPVTPCYGAVLVFERGETAGHVGFAVGHDDDEFYVLGGNQGDSVSITRIAKSRLLGARLPVQYTAPLRPLPRMSAAAIPKSVNEF